MNSATDVRILVGYDGSDDGLAALTFAAGEAAARAGVLHIVYAVDDTVLNSAWGIVFDIEAVRRGGLELLEQARELAHGFGVPLDQIETDCVVGQPAAVLARLSESSSLVVIGRRAESGTRAMFVGSTAVGLAGAAGCPVVVVSALNRLAERRGVIGVGLDAGASGLVAVEWAVKRAARLGSRVHVLSIVKAPQARLFGGGGPDEQQKARALADGRQRVAAAVEGVRTANPAAGVDVEVEVRYGSPIEELASLSREVDLLIVGVHPAFPLFSVGGVVRAMMTHAECVLGVIRHD